MTDTAKEYLHGTLAIVLVIAICILAGVMLGGCSSKTDYRSEFESVKIIARYNSFKNTIYSVEYEGHEYLFNTRGGICHSASCRACEAGGEK